jgi:hypothetical protein
VRITSDDGYSFLVRRNVAIASGTMRDMLDTAGQCPMNSLRHLSPVAFLG